MTMEYQLAVTMQTKITRKSADRLQLTFVNQATFVDVLQSSLVTVVKNLDYTVNTGRNFTCTGRNIKQKKHSGPASFSMTLQIHWNNILSI